MSKVLLFSSGLDSYIAWHILGFPKCLHITGHSRYSKFELEAIKKMGICNLTTIDIGDWMRQYEESDATIPLRNDYFVNIASNYGDIICLVCQKGEQTIPDRSPEFFFEKSRMLSFLLGRTIIINPVFPNDTKQDMVGLYLSRGYPKENLYKTYSCFSDTVKRCGECAACFRTAVALNYNYILPDNFFVKDIWKWEGIEIYIHKLKIGEYEESRTIQTLSVLSKRGLI